MPMERAREDRSKRIHLRFSVKRCGSEARAEASAVEAGLRLKALALRGMLWGPVEIFNPEAREQLRNEIANQARAVWGPVREFTDTDNFQLRAAIISDSRAVKRPRETQGHGARRQKIKWISAATLYAPPAPKDGSLCSQGAAAPKDDPRVHPSDTA